VLKVNGITKALVHAVDCSSVGSEYKEQSRRFVTGQQINRSRSRA
jgi:hypothetical protein